MNARQRLQPPKVELTEEQLRDVQGAALERVLIQQNRINRLYALAHESNEVARKWSMQIAREKREVLEQRPDVLRYADEILTSLPRNLSPLLQEPFRDAAAQWQTARQTLEKLS